MLTVEGENVHLLEGLTRSGANNPVARSNSKQPDWEGFNEPIKTISM